MKPRERQRGREAINGGLSDEMVWVGIRRCSLSLEFFLRYSDILPRPRLPYALFFLLFIVYSIWNVIEAWESFPPSRHGSDFFLVSPTSSSGKTILARKLRKCARRDFQGSPLLLLFSLSQSDALLATFASVKIHSGSLPFRLGSP